MFLLRRTAARAIASTPSTIAFVKPRSIATFTPSVFHSSKRRWLAPTFQKRFASDEAAIKEDTPAKSENFAQTAAEAPIEDLTPASEVQQAPEAQEVSQARQIPETTDAVATAGIEALESAANPAASLPSTRQEGVKPNNSLYVGNLYYAVTPQQLKEIFSKFGEVTSSRVIYDNRGLSRGFGYIEFKNIADAQAALTSLDMQVFEGRNLVVQYHKPKPGNRFGAQNNSPSKTLFIGNMSFEMSDKDLNDLFRDIRNVMDVRVAIDRRTGQPRGFAHADFIDVASATRAKDILGQKTIYGRQLRVDFSHNQSTSKGNMEENGGNSNAQL